MAWQDLLAGIGSGLTGTAVGMGTAAERTMQAAGEEERCRRGSAGQAALNQMVTARQLEIEKRRAEHAAGLQERGAAAAERRQGLTIPGGAAVPESLGRMFPWLVRPGQPEMPGGEATLAGEPTTIPAKPPTVARETFLPSSLAGLLAEARESDRTRRAGQDRMQQILGVTKSADQPGLEMEVTEEIPGGGKVMWRRSRPSRELASDARTLVPLLRKDFPGMSMNPDEWTAEQAQAYEKALAAREGAKTRERTESRITVLTSPEHVEGQARLRGATERARRQVGLEYLPMETRIRAQEELNIATDPANVERVAQKIYEESRARGLAGPLDQQTKEVTQAMQSAIAVIGEIRAAFTPEERRQFVGWITNPTLRLLQAVSAEGNRRFAQFQAFMGRLKKAGFGEAGEQMTETELRLTRQYIPQGNEASFADFEAKLALSDAYAQMIIGGRRRMSGITRGEFSEGAPTQPTMPGPSAPAGAEGPG